MSWTSEMKTKFILEVVIVLWKSKEIWFVNRYGSNVFELDFTRNLRLHYKFPTSEMISSFVWHWNCCFQTYISVFFFTVI